ncbi:glycosyltransferase [Acidothermaceae bacterium B102]|nr:glycosyltransferase [Acidothermaceae bacterium B102]
MPTALRKAGPGRTRDVIVWRDALLPKSETFILHQMNALRTWRPLLSGGERVTDGLPIDPFLVLGDKRYRLLKKTGHSPRLERLMKAPSTGLIHAHFGPDAATVARAAARQSCPLVVTFHGYDIGVPAADISDSYAQRLPGVLSESARMIAVSGFIRERLLAAGAPAGKVVVHHIGIPLPPAAEVATGKEAGLLFVGRLVEKKNLAGLLLAMASLPQHLRATPLRIVGDGPLREASEKLAADLGLNVSFLGARSPEDVAAEMLRATVFCSPGRPSSSGDAEGLPITPLEAAAHALPVVLGKSGGTKDALLPGVTGLLVDAAAPEPIRDALATMLDNPERARAMGQAGRDFVCSEFDIVRQTAKLEALYEDAAR